MELEFRSVADVRTVGRVLEGVAAPYGRPATLPGFTERIQRGAFTRTLQERADVLLLRDHDPRALLARVSNGSLRLEDSADGLRFTAELAQFSAADDTLAMARSGLLAGMSIGFHVRGQEWNASRDQRTLTDIQLVEISAVQSAVAYQGTSIAARACNSHQWEAHSRRRRLAVL